MGANLASVDLELIVVVEDAASSVVRHVNVLAVADIGEGEAPDDVGADGLNLVVLTPVHVGAACYAGAVEHMGGLDALDVGEDALTVLQASSRKVKVQALQRVCTQRSEL